MKTISGIKNNLILNILSEKCPNCAGTQVFEKTSKIFEMPIMRKSCNVCHYKFDREPGYFLGAMYISYAVAVFFGIVTFLSGYFFLPDLPTIYLPIAITAVILLIAKKNYKLSRIIYIYIFPW